MADDNSETKEHIEELVDVTEETPINKAKEEEIKADEIPENKKVEIAPKVLPSPFLTLDKIFTILQLGTVSLLVHSFLAGVGVPHACLISTTLWFGASVVYIAMSSQKLTVDGKSVLITGCDSGFGHALAQHLDKMGFRVFAVCLSDGEGAASLRTSDTIRVLTADVTKLNQLKHVRQQVEEMLPKGEGLWALVNNAGISAFGQVEWFPTETFKNIAEVNVFGLINATQTFLPLIRKSKGRVVNVASVLGRMGLPMGSPYVLTKFAVEGFSDCLRLEMKQWGVSVVVVEPGNFIAGTNIYSEARVESDSKEMWAGMSDENKKDYGEVLFQEQINIMKAFVKNGNTDLSSVIHSFTSALLDKTPQARYQPMDLQLKTRVFVATHLPEWLYDAIY